MSEFYAVWDTVEIFNIVGKLLEEKMNDYYYDAAYLFRWADAWIEKQNKHVEEIIHPFIINENEISFVWTNDSDFDLFFFFFFSRFFENQTNCPDSASEMSI